MVPENVQESDWFFPGDQFWGRDPGFLIFMVHSPDHNPVDEGGRSTGAFHLWLKNAGLIFAASMMGPDNVLRFDWFVPGD